MFHFEYSKSYWTITAIDINAFVLQKLETDNVLLKKDLAFKDSQVKEYETMLASLRESNRQQQVSLNPYFQCH